MTELLDKPNLIDGQDPYFMGAGKLQKSSGEGLMKTWRSKIVTLLVFIWCVSATAVFAAIETTITEVSGNRELYDGKEISVLGTVANLRLKTSKAGNDYTTFSIKGDTGDSINVFIWKHRKLKEGQKVRVTGMYRKAKKVGRYTFNNEIEATEVKSLP